MKHSVLAPVLLACAALLAPVVTHAAPAVAGSRSAPAKLLPIPKPRAVSTRHSVVIAGQRIDYTATAGTLLLYDAKHQATASVFYISLYQKRRARSGAAPDHLRLQRRAGLCLGAGGYRWLRPAPAGVAGAG